MTRAANQIITFFQAVALGFSCALPLYAQDAPEPPVSNSRTATVTVAPAVQTHFRQMATASGSLVARDIALVSPQIGGYPLVSLNAEVGDRVDKGQVLARVDVRVLSANVRQAEASLASAEASLRQAQTQVSSAEATLANAEKTLTRTQSLLDRGAATQAALDDAQAAELSARAARDNAQSGVGAAEAAVAQAQAALEVAQLNLENAEIIAPTAGIISERNATLGMIVAVGGEPMFRLIQDGIVEFRADVVETDLARLRVGQSAQVSIAGLPPMPGQVRLVAPTVDTSNRLGEVRIALDGQENLRPGMYAQAQITLTERDSIGVPAAAVLSDAQGDYVLVERGGVLHRVNVTAGLLSGALREIAAGLEPGDRVVARAGAFFQDGDSVTPVEDAQ
ncbi:efflux RND transporter periplasmic adaptor subunit [Tropicibacter naphthalenivorans]|uniref:Macrolide-specific efflux protein MacA n=1 Tax=Tropicibacter naphthalenivorans TaxID=441103 RepID=A0A0P1G4P2_9RHOB|nr:efflux RND transporter periplasmic adaptor subunit [Tropicibacter naphthalenivorans]CUH76631.1 Macrolide-specific efflux protein MacA precursor [Tropicibacter naphthalenivorans]SMC64436.1 HlyD family secretion protein [Tropicibacter naphthalenivorans]